MQGNADWTPRPSQAASSHWPMSTEGVSMHMGMVLWRTRTLTKGTALLLSSSAVRKPEPEHAKQVADKETGADCKRILKAAADSKSTSVAVKQRFREGSIDEVSFLGGLLEALQPCRYSNRRVPWQDDLCLGVRMQLCAIVINNSCTSGAGGMMCKPVALTQQAH